MPERPKALFYVGQTNAEGRPTEYFPGVPARDLDEADIASLSDGQVAEAAASSLYQKSKPGSRETATSSTRTATAKKSPTKKPSAPKVPETVAIEPTPAPEPTTADGSDPGVVPASQGD